MILTKLRAENETAVTAKKAEGGNEEVQRYNKAVKIEENQNEVRKCIDRLIEKSRN